MSLRILFADDSMTAQNMGKRILTDAGYEVIAVSNGAAAVKKIAEHKPDIIILDVYMPGYTGLEVCEKVRASIETLKTPVLLTVGKMEPYRAEDANRVKADGVIIKPFEASDLIAIVKKLEERITPKSVPLADQTIMLDRPPDFSQFAAAAHASTTVAEAPVPPAPAHVEETGQTLQATVEVPDHMATASAFSDLLGTEPAPVMHTFTVEPDEHATEELPVTPAVSFNETSHVEEHRFEASVPHAFEASIPEIHTITPEIQEPVPEIHAVAAPEVAAIPEVHAVAVPEIHAAAAAAAAGGPALEMKVVNATGVELEPESSIPDTQPIPVYVELEPETTEVQAEAVVPQVSVHHPAGFEPTIPETTVEVPATVDPAFEQQEPIEVSAATDPQLVSEHAALESFPTKFGVENAEDVPVGIVAAEPEAEVAAAPVEHRVEHHEPAAETPVSEDDFDARVAAAMAAYDDQVSDLPTEREESIESESGTAEAEVEPHHVIEAETPVSFEYVPPISAPELQASEVEAKESNPVEETASGASGVPPVRHESEPPTGVMHAYSEDTDSRTEQVIASEIESELPKAAAAAASNSGADSHVVAEVVHRVMERFKPELIAEIVRELKLKK